MNEYLEGTAIEIPKTFLVAGTPTDPTAVSFFLRRWPATVATEYEFGVAAIVTNPEVGVYQLNLPGTLVPGYYRYRVEGTGDVEAADEGDFTIIASATLAEDNTGLPVGPCSPWIDGDAVDDLCDTSVTNTSVYDQSAYIASELLFMYSGQLFPGECVRTSRPCAQDSTCWGDRIMIPGQAGPIWSPMPGGWGWAQDGAPTCSCVAVSRVPLPGYPIVSIVEVLIDGDPVDPAEYTIEDWMWLARIGDGAWPSCQNKTLPASEPGTWEVTYLAGRNPPHSGELAAAELACQIYKSVTPGELGECKLPAGVTSLQRQGVSMDRQAFLAFGLGPDRRWNTGLKWVDAFLNAYNPDGRQTGADIWSPDIPQVA